MKKPFVYNGPYNADFFLGFFSAIPEEKFITGVFDGPAGTHCAAGFCRSIDECRKPVHGREYFPTSWKLSELLRGASVTHINDGRDPRYQQPTPKQRILAALEDAKREGR